MLSIIICSRTLHISKQLSENIAESVGCTYELIVIDNSQNQYSIFEAYNIGIKKSKGIYWCFIHDDILFRTQDWGQKIEGIFEENIEIGLIGVAGSKIKTRMPSAWWDCPHEFIVVNITHQLKDKEIDIQNHGFEYNDTVEVSIIDGVFMVGRATASICFDEKLKGFHHYDLYLCLQYLKNQFKIVVTNLVLIEHFSVGNIDECWIKSALVFDEKYSKMLPLSRGVVKDTLKINEIEFKNGVFLFKKLIELNLKKSAFLIWLRMIKNRPFSKLHFKFFKFLFVKK